MKKFICLLLVLWLPLFSGAAAAMSLQMQLAAMPAVAHDMPCHETAPDPQPAADAAADHAAQPCCDEHEASHNCFACGVCALVHSTTSATPGQQLTLPALASSAPHYYGRIFSSQLYPPALKPPISA